MLIPNRFDSLDDYRYGFNGQEKDDELKGKGNSVNYEARMQDTRVGRFLSVVPLTKQFAELSPYQFASNTPIQAIDLDGLEQYHYNLSFDKKGKSQIKLTHETHFKYEHWRWGTSRILGVSIPVPERYYTEDHKWVVHTGTIHEGLTPDNSAIYRMEITRQFDTKQEMLDWIVTLEPSDLQKFDDNYTKLDQVGHFVYNVQDVYRDSRPGVSGKTNTTNSNKSIDNKALVSLSGKPGGGAKLESIAKGTRDRIQAIANKYNLEITVVGSQAKGTSGEFSDWDYIIKGGNSKSRSSAMYQLPKNPKAAKDGDKRPGSEELKGVEVDKTKPHITFSSQ